MVVELKKFGWKKNWWGEISRSALAHVEALPDLTALHVSYTNSDEVVCLFMLRRYESLFYSIERDVIVWSSQSHGIGQAHVPRATRLTSRVLETVQNAHRLTKLLSMFCSRRIV
jgi:hypothetical protein